MEKTCKTCINLCNKRGEVEGCKNYRSEVQEIIKEIDKKLTVEEAVRIIQKEGYYDWERYAIGENMELGKYDNEEELEKLGWGHDEVYIDDEDIEAIKKGEIVGFFDGEYTHRLIYKVKEE